MEQIDIIAEDGTRLAAYRVGEGPPLVVVHGSTGSHMDYLQVAPLLAEHHTVWLYDRRGYGASADGPHDLGVDVDDVVAMLDAAGPEAHLLGHSYGAVCALLASARRPTASLTLYEPPLAADRMATEVDRAIEMIDAGRVAEGLESFLTEVASVSRDELTFIRALAQVWDKLRAGAVRLPREVRALRAAGVSNEVAQPMVSTQFLIGGCTTSGAFLEPAEVTASFPRADVRILSGQAHLAHAFAPRDYAEAVISFTCGAIDGRVRTRPR